MKSKAIAGAMDSRQPISPTKTSFPKSVLFIFWNEFAERFSFYGFKAILTTFLAGTLLVGEENPEAMANEYTHIFVGLCFLFGVLGGILADWFIGKYRTILYLSIVYCIGHAVIAFFTTSLTGFTLGLLLIALGSGGIKPCVSAFLGDQMNPTDEKGTSRTFSIFYFMINVGAFLSSLFIPIISEHYGPAIGFGVPGIFMAGATILFVIGKKHYLHAKPTRIPKTHFLKMSLIALKSLFQKKSGTTIWEKLQLRFSAPAVDDVKKVWKIVGVFAFICLYQGMYDQSGSEWVQQAKKMDLHFMGISWLAEQIQTINPVLILVLVPLFSFVVYPLLERIGINVRALGKMQLGMGIGLVSFIMIYFIQLQIDGGATPNIAWQLLAYVLLTISEVLVLATGLEYAYVNAPTSMKSTITSFWLMTVSIGNFFVGWINGLLKPGTLIGEWMMSDGALNANFYLFFAGLLVVNLGLFYSVGKKLKG